jgi:hypothetical protein
MFGKSKDDNDPLPSVVQHPERPVAAKPAEQGSAEQVSTISRGMTIVGKIFGEGTLNVFGQVEGELRALNVLVNEGARVEGDGAPRSGRFVAPGRYRAVRLRSLLQTQ